MGIRDSNVEEALQAERDGADYIGVGAVFSTNTKKNTKNVTIKMLQAVSYTHLDVYKRQLYYFLLPQQLCILSLVLQT